MIMFKTVLFLFLKFRSLGTAFRYINLGITLKHTRYLGVSLSDSNILHYTSSLCGSYLSGRQNRKDDQETKHTPIPLQLLAGGRSHHVIQLIFLSTERSLKRWKGLLHVLYLVTSWIEFPSFLLRTQKRNTLLCFCLNSSSCFCVLRLSIL